MTDANLVEIFCILDEFCKYLEPELKKRAIESDPEKVRRNRKPNSRYDKLILRKRAILETVNEMNLRMYVTLNIQGIVRSKILL